MAERTLRLSVLDRLLDAEPRLAADPPLTWDESVRRHKAALLRDLEWLLNTRRIIEPAPAAYPEVQRSLYHYGLPDLSSLGSDRATVRQRLTHYLEESIELFEPRLVQVRVTAAEPAGGTEQHLRFVVDALLRMDPNPERVIFDTLLETVSGEFRVRGADDA